MLLHQRVREQSISLLKDLLHTHDVDPRYGHPSIKSRIADLYFPFIILTVDFQPFLEGNLEVAEQENWLLCYFYIIANCSNQLLHDWWRFCEPERNADFFQVLVTAASTLEYHPLYKAFCFIMVDVTLDYISTFKTELMEPNNLVLPKIFLVLQALQYNQSVGFVVALYNLLAVTSTLFSKAIFSEPDSFYCESLTYQVLYHCNSEKVSVRNKACSLYYYLLCKNFEETSDVNRMRLQSTVSLCRLLSGEQKVIEYGNLRESLAVISGYAEKNQSNTTLKQMIVDGVKLVSRLLRFNEQLVENDQNPQVMEELFIKIANSYFHSPKLHITWLEALATHHTDVCI